MISEYAVLIPSCDKYSDMWDPFFSQFWKYWPDCPYNVYLGSNLKKYKGKKVKNILIGEDFGWAYSFKKTLQQIKEKYLFIWPEDALIISKINTNQFKNSFLQMEKYDIKHIHFRCMPQTDKYIENNLLGIYEKGMPYRVNMAGFWNKNYLEKVVIVGENSWNFEIMGSYRVSYDDGFYCLRKQFFRYVHLVEKGRWNRDSINYCDIHKIKIDLSRRQINNKGNHLANKLRDIHFNYFINKNWRLRLALMNLFRKLLISY